MLTHSTAYSEPLQTQHLKLETILDNAIYVISSGWDQVQHQSDSHICASGQEIHSISFSNQRGFKH